MRYDEVESNGASSLTNPRVRVRVDLFTSRQHPDALSFVTSATPQAGQMSRKVIAMLQLRPVKGRITTNET